jgi:hypothetical protein
VIDTPPALFLAAPRSHHRIANRDYLYSSGVSMMRSSLKLVSRLASENAAVSNGRPFADDSTSDDHLFDAYSRAVTGAELFVSPELFNFYL